MWKEHNIFFATPQTISNDLEKTDSSGNCVVPVDRITCVIFDECHKATGDYAYTKMVKLIDTSAARYRIIGLSATPGQNMTKVNEVIMNLRTEKVEFRTEEDVSEYTNKKSVELMIIKQPKVSRRA